MKQICRATTKQLSSLLDLTEYTSKSGKKFWYKDNGGKVLFVAHADTVKRPGVFQPVKGRDDTRIYSPTWDDRAGIYVYTYFLKMGLKMDFLLTEDEEQGKSTALWFDAPKKYNWMCMFDRKGTDAVCYQYTDETLKYRLGKHNFNVGWGSYSCIRDLEHLGVQGINFGVGYHNNHDEWAYLSVTELRRNLRKFISFYREYKGIRMLHDLGYERFAESVEKHSYEQTREDQEESFMIPALSIERKYHAPYRPWKGKDRIDDIMVEDADYMMVADDKPDFAFDDYGELKASNMELEQVKKEILEESKAMMLVDEHGVLRGLRADRNINKLYWPLEMLNKHDPSVKNILANTFNCRNVYDVVQISPWRLCAQGNLTLEQAEKLREWVIGIGFNMPYNLQSFKTPEKWFHEEKGRSYNRRKVIMSTGNDPRKLREDVAKQADKFLKKIQLERKVEKHAEPSKTDRDQIKELTDKVNLLERKYSETTSKNWKTRWAKKINEAKDILSYAKLKIKGLLEKKKVEPVYGPANRPSCVTPDELTDKFKSSKYIQLFPLPEGKGNYEELITTAKELRDQGDYDLDVMFTCGQCRKSIVFDVDKHNQLPKVCEDCEADLNSEEGNIMLVQEEALEPSNTILTKVQLIKEHDDDSIFKFNGKPNGEKGIEKYIWSTKQQIGFVRDNA